MRSTFFPIAAMLVAASAMAAPPHQHGVAALDVVVQGDTLQLGLDSPLDNLVGFEHAPANEREAAAIRDMARRFARAQALFVPSPEARCSVKSVELASPVIDPKVLAAAGVSASPAGASHEEAGHADLDATIVFHCGRAAALASLDVRLFAAFPGMRRINAQVVTPARQSAAVLTAESSKIAF